MIYLTVTAILVLLSLYNLSIRNYGYWKKKNVKFITPVLVFGNFTDYILLRKPIWEVVRALCKLFPNDLYFGAFVGAEPTLIVQDPEIIKLVLTKDFYYFSGKDGSKYTHNETITQSLPFTYGDRWKVLRQNLSPLFSSSKMRDMFETVGKCCGVLESVIGKESLVPEVEIRSLMMRFTLDSISGCVFGVDTNVMMEPNNIFEIMGDLIFKTTTYRGFKNMARTVWPTTFYGLGFKLFPKDITVFFTKFIKGVFEDRGYKSSSRNDFLDLMLTLKENKYITGNSLKDTKKEEDLRSKVSLEVDDDLLVAQCVGFFGAGFETSASTTSFTLYELAKDLEVQRQVQREVDLYIRSHNNKLGYDCVKEFPYLEACVDETLRLYPVFGVLSRETMVQYTFPTGLTLGKGVRVHVPVYHLHHDAKYFPDPQVFKPERFYGERKKEIKPYTYLPFGEGPRICIGMRFAKMLMLAALITILKSYTVELAEGMPEKVNFDPKAIVTRPTIGIRLKFLQRDNSP